MNSEKFETTVEILKEMAFTATETQRRALEEAISAVCDYKKMQEISLDLAFENDELINKSRWIPVSERLPEKNVWVLVTVEQNGKRFQEIMRRNIYNGEWADNINFYTDEITAWMPLPEPYKAERGKADEQT